MTTFYQSLGKRAFDVTASAFLLIALSPILALAAAAVYFAMGSPIFFRQDRPGLAGRPFRLVKFRSMRMCSGRGGAGESDADRLTSVGRFLRQMSIDELPELWNVLIGEMSLVGPRPLLMRYLERYNHTQARRHEVRPGITGYAQIRGRNSISWEEKFTLDVWYVDHVSFFLDLKILLMTFTRVLFARGISQQGSETMEEFRGSGRATKS